MKLILAASFLFCCITTSRISLAEPPILRLSMEEEPSSFDWQKFRSPSERFMTRFLMRGLIKYEDSNPICDLCERYEINSSKDRYDFFIPKTLRWSDGEPLRAQHFVDAFQRTQSIPELKSVERKSDFHLVLTLKKPQSNFLHILSRSTAFPIRKRLAQKASKDQGIEMAQVILGPYLLAAWEKGKRIVLEGNPEWKAKRPVYRVEFILGSHSESVERFKKGKIDALADPTTDEVMQVQNSRLQINSYWATRFLALNFKRTPTSDARFRRALLYGINRASLPALLKNGERPSTGMIPAEIEGHRSLPLATPDAARAQSERHRAIEWSKEVKQTLLVKDHSTEVQIANFLKSELSHLKIKLDVRKQKGNAYYRDLINGEFDLALVTWVFQTASPMDLLQSFGTGHPLNRGGWTNVGYDALLERAKLESDPKKRADHLNQITRFLEQTEVAAIPLSYPSRPFLLSYRVLEFPLTPFGEPDLLRIRLKE